MSSKIHNIQAVVIGSAWPSNTSGSGIATQSCLQQYIRVFSKVHFIGLVDHSFEDIKRWTGTNVTWSHIPIIRRAKWFRFLCSLFSPLPAITIQFSSRIARQQLIEMVGTYKKNREKEQIVVIFEDIPPASLLFCLRQKFPLLPIAVRSENVASKVFEKFGDEGNLFSRIVWKIEVSKTHKIEGEILKAADRVWTISETELDEYHKRFGFRPHGVFGVSVDSARYSNIASGDIFTLLYLGGTSLRKRPGMLKFINQAWKDVRSVHPSAKFLLAGQNTEQFTRTDLEVYGTGFCEDERDFLSKGLIFINLQEVGAGITLKSIIAMLAGKALVSTEVGVEGIVGQHGKQFLVAKETKDLAPLVIKLMSDQQLAIKMGKQAQELATKVYDDINLSRVVKPLLEDFVTLVR